MLDANFIGPSESDKSSLGKSNKNIDFKILKKTSKNSLVILENNSKHNGEQGSPCKSN
jgi:hypothetical protein